MTRHLWMDRFDQTECGLPAENVPAPDGPNADCDYCLNGRAHPQAKEFYDYHRAQLEVLARAARSGAYSGNALPRARDTTKEGYLGPVSTEDLATLRAWAERLKYASRSAVADFLPAELRALADALGRVLGH